jgi:hypothetical protein
MRCIYAVVAMTGWLAVAAAEDVDFTGKYQSPTLSADIVGQSDGTYVGTLHLNGSDLPLRAQVQNGILQGTFTRQGQDFIFTASLNGDELTLESGTSNFELKRPPAPPRNPLSAPVPPAAPAPAAPPPAPVAPPPPTTPILPATAPTVAAAAAAAPAAEPELPPGAVKFTRVVIKDTQVTGMDAYTMLLPTGWQYTGRILWDQSRTAAPWDLLVHATNADQTLAFTYAPSLMMVWSSLYQKNYQQMGGESQGCPIVKPVDGPVAGIKKVIIPMYLKAIGKNYHVVSSKELPKAAAAYAPTYNKPGQPQGIVKAGKVRIEYVRDGKSYEQEIFCVYLRGKGPGVEIWGLDHIMSYRAVKGSLDAAMPEFTFMSLSLQPTPKFFEAGKQITDKLIAGFYQQAEAQRVQMMQQIAQQEQAQQKVAPTNMVDWEARQKAADATFENYESGAVRGVNDYVDPNDSNSIIQVDDSYSRAFANSNSVIATHNSNYTPPSNLGYTELQRVPAP